MSFASSALSDELAKIYDLDRVVERAALRRTHGGTRSVVFDEVIRQARALGARTAIVERRYIDYDYRSEHARFYSTTFRRYPSVASRAHFFLEEVPDMRAVNRIADDPAALQAMTCVGYAVLRPVPGAPVGRTVIQPPELLSKYVTCAARDRTHLFGTPIDIRGMPFYAQDGQLAVCAHAAAWMTAYQHHLTRHSGRRVPADVFEAAPRATGLGRRVPSTLLSVFQLNEVYSTLGMAALIYNVDKLDDSQNIDSLIEPYIASGYPVTVGSGTHVFVLTGVATFDKPSRARSKFQEYAASAAELAAKAQGFEVNAATRELIKAARTFYISHDDEVGPYQVRVRDVMPHTRWEFFLVPLPEDIYLSAENARDFAVGWLHEQLSGPTAVRHTRELRARIDSGEITYRVTAIDSNKFKRTLVQRKATGPVVANYRRSDMSRYVWVVELVDLLRRPNEPNIIGEMVVDATGHVREEYVLAWRLPTAVGHLIVDRDEPTPPIEVSPAVQYMDSVRSVVGRD